MSLDSPRSCGGFSTPRLPSDMVRQPDLFRETDVSQDNGRKVDLKERVCQDAERDTSCGDIRNQDACYEELSHKAAMLEAKLTAEIHARHQQNILMLMNEKRARDKLVEKNGEVELLKVEKQNLESECRTLRAQLEITSKHLNAVEILFTSVHEKYEKSKHAVQILNRNVEILKNSLTEHKECVRQKHDQFLKLKEHAIERLDYANVELDLIQKRHTTETAKLRTALDKSELRRKSISEQLECKTKENEDMISICDSLLKNLDSTGDFSFERLVAAIWKDQQSKNALL